MAEIHADLLSLILALEVPDVVAVTTIHIEPDPSGYLATFSFMRSVPGVPVGSTDDDEDPGFVLGQMPVAVYRLAWRVPILVQLQALHDSGLLGHLDVVWFRPSGTSNWNGSREYIVRTHAGSFDERAEWVRELLVDLNVGG